MASSAAPRRDPLSEVLLRRTTGPTDSLFGPSPSPSVEVPAPPPTAARPANPVRPATAMARSRAAILEGARKSVEVSGTRITMAQVAAAAGVAKATLYNHFRTREEVLEAVLLSEIEGIVHRVDHLELNEALLRAASAISEHSLLETLGYEQQTLAMLSRVDVRSKGWLCVAEAVEGMLARRGVRGTPTVLRWLSSFILSPADPVDIAIDIRVLVAGLPPR